MSELRVYHVTEAYNDLDIRFVYNKDEADKVIAEKDKEIERQNTEIEFAVMELKLREQKNDELTIALKEKDEEIAELNHANYKRCLAMAMWCDAEGCWYESQGEDSKAHWFFNWQNKWLEIAEKFKEAK